MADIDAACAAANDEAPTPLGQGWFGGVLARGCMKKFCARINR